MKKLCGILFLLISCVCLTGCGNANNTIDVGIVVSVTTVPGTGMSNVITDKPSAVAVSGDATTDIKKGDRVKVRQVNGKDDILYKDSLNPFAKSFRVLKRW
jgi:hypothetical protein